MTDFHYAEDYPLAPLEDDCRLLSSLLDDCLRIEVGEGLFEKYDKIRTTALCASQLAAAGDQDSAQYLARRMINELHSLPLEEALPLTRAFGHFLNLTMQAEIQQSVRVGSMELGGSSPQEIDTVFAKLLAGGLTPDELYEAVVNQRVEVVLTAHPTQVNRRTLQHKHTRVAALLAQNDRPELTAEDKERVLEELMREITALWQTDELRRRKPTPVDEARGGLHIVEQSLWAAIPHFLRRVSAALKRHTGRELPISATPVVFGSWMGGDRDGNPNVTSKVTRDVAAISRWMAVDLYLREVDALRFELSMNHANDEVWRMARKIAQAAHADEVKAAVAAAALANSNASAAAGGAKVLTSAVSVDMGSLATPSATPSLRTMRPVKEEDTGPHNGGVPLAARQSLAALTEGNVSMPMPSLSAPAVPTIGESLPLGSPPSNTFWPGAESSPPTNTGRPSGLKSLGPSGADLRCNSFDSRDSLLGTSPQSPTLACNQLEPSGSVGYDLQAMSRAAQKMAGLGGLGGSSGAVQQHTDDSESSLIHARMNDEGFVELPDDIKERGMHAAAYHKTSVDRLLRPRRDGATPYRIVLGDVRQKLVNTRRRMEQVLEGMAPEDDDPWYDSEEQLAEPLLACYWSLWECGGGIIAEGRLLDLLRRVFTFGLSLLKLDLRQEAGRHTDAVNEITTYLDLGDYASMSEEQKIEFLTRELEGRRPLVPKHIPLSPDAKEVMDTFRMAAELGRQSLSAYVISMANKASDVLAVELLQKEARNLYAGEAGRSVDPLAQSLRVVPLFETLDDLAAGGKVLRQLLAIPWYRTHLKQVHGHHQEVMLGYSDSGKDAGRMAASWALYKCQEDLVAACKEHGVKLTLFHGRGGSIGRGGGPLLMAIQSQPPGSVEGTLRITEQGEMVQAKFGMPAVAERQLDVFITSVLMATKAPPNPAKHPEWRSVMEEIGEVSCQSYRQVVFQHPNFISYFRNATPEEELGNLNIGSRPARRKKGGGVETLRAIPWIFAWTQTRLALPAWLGVAAGLQDAIKKGHLEDLKGMYRDWPFFQSTIDLIEMILAKADMRIAALYDEVLVSDEKERELGRELRQGYLSTVSAILQVTGHSRLCENNPTLRRLIEMRNPSTDPINMMQVEILNRLRKDPTNDRLRDALLISINGIAAGMRNTG